MKVHRVVSVLLIVDSFLGLDQYTLYRGFEHTHGSREHRSKSAAMSTKRNANTLDEEDIAADEQERLEREELDRQRRLETLKNVVENLKDKFPEASKFLEGTTNGTECVAQMVEFLRTIDPQAIPTEPAQTPAKSTTTSTSNKRRATTPTLNLKQFVHLIISNFIGVKLDENNKIVIPNKPLLHLVNVPGGREILREIVRNDSALRSTIPNIDLIKIEPVLQNPEVYDPNHDKHTDQNLRKRIFRALIMRAFSEIDQTNIKLAFSSELLKQLLVVSDVLLRPDVFAKTSSIKVNNASTSNGKSSDSPETGNGTTTTGRKSKLNSPGAILHETVRGPDSFSMALAQADEQDVDALRMIATWSMQLPFSIYTDYCETNGRQIDFPVTKYEPIQSSAEISLDENYTKIQLPSFKQMIVMVTKYAILVYENGKFVPTQVAVEKDIPTRVMNTEGFNYAIFDMLMSAKNRVLDILALSMERDKNNKPKPTKLPERFQDRLRLVQDIFPSLKCVNLSSNVNDTSNSLYKPNIGHGTVYMFTKPNFVGAIVAIADTDVYVAGLEGEDTLSVVNKYSIAGSYAYTIMLHYVKDKQMQIERRKMEEDTGEVKSYHGQRKIRYEEKEYNLSKLPDVKNLYVFTEVLKVEIRDGNKLGGYSKHDISNVQNMKLEPPTEESMKITLLMLDQKPQEVLNRLSKNWRQSSFVKAFKQCDKLDNIPLQENYPNI